MSRRSYKEKGGHDSKGQGVAWGWGTLGKLVCPGIDSVVVRRWGSWDGKGDLEKALLCLGRQHKDCGRVLLGLLQTHILWGGNDATNTRRACLDRRERKILNAAFERLSGSLLRPETRAAAVWVWTGRQVHVQMRAGPRDPFPMECMEPSLPVIFQAGRTQG